MARNGPRDVLWRRERRSDPDRHPRSRFDRMRAGFANPLPGLGVGTPAPAATTWSANAGSKSASSSLSVLGRCTFLASS